MNAAQCYIIYRPCKKKKRERLVPISNYSHRRQTKGSDMAVDGYKQFYGKLH
jgi:hypothetical protein